MVASCLLVRPSLIRGLGLLPILWFFSNIASGDFVLVNTSNGYLWDRPTSPGLATYQAWESFASIGGPNAPQTVFGAGTGDTSIITTGTSNANFGFGGPDGAIWAPVNAAGTANIFNTLPDSFLTSGGNIYSPGAIVAPRIVIPNNIDGSVGNQTTGGTFLTIQLRTQGSLPDLNSFFLNDPVSGLFITPLRSQVLATQAAGGFGGTIQDLLVDFYAAGNADTYEIEFRADSSSMSLDRVSVDTFFSPSAVPEPNSLTLGMVATLFLVGRRKRA